MSDKNDLLRRQDCIEAIEGITCSMSLCVNADECHGMKRMQRQAVLEIANMPAAQPDHVADISKKAEKEDCISRQVAIDAIMGQPPESHYPSWYAAQIEKLPAVQPDHNADIGKKVSISCAHENDVVSRKAAIEAIEKAKMAQTPDGEIYVAKYNAEMNIQLLPTVQPVLTCDGCQHNGYFKHDICRRCLRNMRDLYEPE